MKTILMIIGGIFVLLFSFYLYGDGVISILDDLTRHISKEEKDDDNTN